MKYNIYFLFLIALSCQIHNQAEVTYISSSLVQKNGQKKSPNYSFIHLKNDSVFFRDLYKPETLTFMGEIPKKKSEFLLDGLTFKFTENILEISNSNVKSIYRILDKENNKIKIDKFYFKNKKFVLKSKFNNDTIFFSTANSYRNMTSNSSDRWSFVDIDGYKVLWLNLGYDEVPLIIESFDNKEITANLYGLKKNKVILKELFSN
ncbi:hypothetical protein [Gelidibacter salicanalis]|uniref:Uncharacterized protein n=1 Tax=Gelidibacter salicanalis TaxID=291193 RepID=A0A934NHZ8_9FLAO|nr:hypothetical protein [Gelidibacter salicanalis]MBJ7880438.1 hypothetical protein [Gelidibacter salicanalis]